MYIKNKISKAIGIMYKARQHLNKQALVNLNYSYMYPYLTYCLETWGCASKTQLHCLFLLQKKHHSYNLLLLLSRSHRAYIYVFGNFTI